MSLEAYQKILAQLYTDEKFRQEFWQNPEKWEKAQNLDKKQIQELRQNHQKAIFHYSLSLINKRFRAVSHFLPHSLQILSQEQAKRLFQVYAAQQTLTRKDRYAEDAYAFATFLSGQVSIQEAWQKELIRFEQMHIRRECYFFHWHFFRYDLPAMITNFSSLPHQASLPTQVHTNFRRNLLCIHFHLGKVYRRWQIKFF